MLNSAGIEAQNEDTALFKDDSEISTFAYESVYMMKKLGLLQGSDGFFEPQAMLTRAESAQFNASLMTFLRTLNDESVENTENADAEN